MDLTKISAGDNLPNEFNVIIEVPMEAAPVKYEMDKESGALFVDRVIQAAMHYPCNYGFIPNTLSEDGDPTDVLVMFRFPVQPGSVIAARPIGVLLMEDEKGPDEKILAVPLTKLDPCYEGITTYKDLPSITLECIANFFENYKKLEKNKWVKIIGWADKTKAMELINNALIRK